ncbi:MAG: metal-sulfur cluster assembly factor [Acidimicrobiales bacterium]
MSPVPGFHGAPASGADDDLDVVWRALRTVDDPELRLDVVSLGLVYDVRRDGDGVVIEMTMTTPGCPAAEIIPEMAHDAVAAAFGDGPVDVRVVWDPPWDPSMIDEAAFGARGYRRR